ncbi:MAG: response regulator [Desulfatiglandales bacterium]
MEDERILESKKILIVDDEPDILEMLEELLFMCEVVSATSFQEAKKELETRHFDIAILDIMGVGGYQLLEIANEKEIPAVMLTAHALSPEDTVKSFKGGAASYVPKDRMVDIQDYLADILKAPRKGKNARWLWLKKLGSYYDKKFGPDWKRSDEKFWEKFVK